LLIWSGQTKIDPNRGGIVLSLSDRQIFQVAEARQTTWPQPASLWVEVLADCPGTPEPLIYAQPDAKTADPVVPGDIVSVPLGSRQVGAIVLNLRDHLPEGLQTNQVRAIAGLVCHKFFPPDYWPLLHQVAAYYCTPLITVVRAALPPGLLSRSQRRIRLCWPKQTKSTIPDLSDLPSQAETQAQFEVDDLAEASSNLVAVGQTLQALAQQAIADPTLSAGARAVLAHLRQSPSGSYSWQHLQRQGQGFRRGIQELLRRGWVESLLEAPTPVRPKRQQVVTLVAQATTDFTGLTPRQREVVEVLRRRGGELWLTELLQLCQVSSSVVTALVGKGVLTQQQQEVLRHDRGPALEPDQPRCLTKAQAQALSVIQQYQTQAVQILLHGVTGSGKTEVYLQAIAPVLARGKSVLVLVPEIGLTPQLTDRFRQRFQRPNQPVLLYHSALSAGERYDAWRQMLLPHPCVVIGTRSAIFAPLPNLGLIILDEEHDDSFKQDQPPPCYHARTVAQWRASLAHCPLILGSATPALESWLASQSALEVGKEQADNQPENQSANLDKVRDTTMGKISQLPTVYLSMPDRVMDLPLPPVTIVDMRQEFHQGNRSIFSRSLQTALYDLQTQGGQGILFIHRRGYSTFVSCRACGEVLQCPHCDVSLAYHQPSAEGVSWLRCHYCNFVQPQPDCCPVCQSSALKQFGSGTQRVVQELARQFPALRYLRYDSDTTRTKGAHRSLLNQFAQGEADVLVGTQMLTKGLDLPSVTLVGIIAADGLLHLPDYRASERAFQILTQVAGRAGRGDRGGKVILQTYTPAHAVVRAVQQQTYVNFAEAELAQRSALKFPPYGRLVLFRLSSVELKTVQQTALQIAALLQTRITSGQLLGPAPAPIARVARRYRWQILLKLVPEASWPDFSDLKSYCPSGVSLTIDVEPLNLS